MIKAMAMALFVALKLAIPSSTTLEQLQALMKTDPAQAEQIISQKFTKDDLAAGIKPYAEGTTVLFAIDAGQGDHEAYVSGDNFYVTLKPVGGLLAAVVTLREGEGHLVSYTVDDKSVGKPYQMEVYTQNPDVQPPPGGVKGELRDMGVWLSKIYPNTTRHWYIYLPPNLDPNHEYPLFLATDAQWDRQWMANALENCARKGIIPPTVGVFVEPGQDTPGDYLFDRPHEYDELNDNYSQFIFTEILPQVEKIVKLSHDPSQRATSGVSSGGIAGFTLCWRHPDSFGTVISAVGSFDNIAGGVTGAGGGHNYPFIIRLSDKEPIRVFFADGSHDLDNKYGNWWLSSQQMAAALRFKGYDYVFAGGEGFHSSDEMRSIYDKALAFWNGIKK